MRRSHFIRSPLGVALLTALFLVACDDLNPAPDPSLTPSGSDETCARSFGSTTFENLKVPDGRTCVLNGTRVKGNIVVGTRATLRAQNIRVEGNIQSEGHTLVLVEGRSTVGGSVQLKQGRNAVVADARINGDLQLTSNRGELNLSRNVIGGNLQAKQNSGPLVIRSNRIDSALQCQANRPAPTGGGNRASSKEDQCARL